MMSIRKKNLNLFFNFLLVVLVAISIYLMLTTSDGFVKGSKLHALKYFTVQSNIFIGISAFISLIYLLFKNRYPTWVVVLKLVSTTCLTLTFLTVMGYLAPLMGIFAVFLGANLYMHLFIPVVSIISFIFIEPKIELKFKWNFFSIIPSGTYGTIYIICLIAFNDFGNVDGWDWYAFGTYGLGVGFIMLIGLNLVAFGSSCLLYILHKKVNNKVTDN